MEVDYVQAVLEGGVVAYTILGLSVVLMAATVAGLVTMREGTLCPTELFLEVSELLDGGRQEEAAAVVEADPSVLARVLETGLTRSDSDGPAATEVMHDAAGEEALRLMQRVSYIGLIAAVAPMLGLLGTVAGMIEAFATLESSAAAPQTGALAGAISKALITTFLGLVVAIPALVVHLVMRNRVTAILLRVSELADRLAGRMSAKP